MNTEPSERVHQIRERLRLNGYTPTSKEDVRLLLLLHDQRIATVIAAVRGLKHRVQDIVHHGGSHYDAVVESVEKRNAILDEVITVLEKL